MNLSVAIFDSELRAARRVSACIDAFMKVLQPFGVDTLAAGEIDLSNKSLVVFYAIAWPAEWMRFYFGNRLQERDPVVTCLGFYEGAFSWTDMRQDKRFTGLTRETFGIARQHGWLDGLVVPLPRGGTRYGLVSLAARDHPFTNEVKGLVSILSIAFHERVRALAPNEGFPRPPAGLTDRERECLQLIARGCSDRAIASQLGIGEVTARSHFEGARGKLQSDTRAQTVAKAMSWGIISA